MSINPVAASMNDSVPTNSDSPTRWKAPHFAAGAVILVVGVLAGRSLFPLVVEKPFVVEKRVEIPVERIVEKRIAVPVEKIVYVSERAKGGTGAEAFLISPQKLAMWKQIKVGMTRKEVTDILGAPSSVDGDISINPKTGERSVMWEWRTDGPRGGVWFAFGGDGRALSVVIPER
jgi:hypothetical protein